MEKMGVIISLVAMAVVIMAQGGHGSAVHDTDGHLVQESGRYYVVDEATNELVVSYARRSPEASCPLVAVVPISDVSLLPHVPISFSLENPTPYISESQPLSISFDVSYWPCPNQKTTVWTVNEHSPATKYNEITFGGLSNHKLTNFTIESDGDGYKFVHVDEAKGKKYAIGVQSVPSSGFKRLVLLDETKPFVFVLKNARKTFKRSSLLSMVPFFK